MSALPFFGEKGNRWSLGSNVIAFWWTTPSPEELGGMLLGPKLIEETSDACQVTGIRKGGPEGWLVTVTFGPLLDLTRTTEFNPSQIRKLARDSR